jgi:hypothetical protein
MKVGSFYLVAALVGLAGCTTVRLEYDRMTGTALPAETTFDGETVNLATIYLQGDILLSVMEDDTGIAPLTGPADPADPTQYDYITPAELETIEAAYRTSSLGPASWTCKFWIFSGTCTRYHIYGIVADHYEEKADGTRLTSTMGLMYDSDSRGAFANFYKHNTVRTHNQKYLRSAAHEAGHAFNLNHCDGDGATTIMNQTSVVGDSYTYKFSAASLEHLQDHDRNAVWPGISDRDYACPHVH